MDTASESQAAAAVAALLGHSERIVRWRDDAPLGRALVIHAPWARVVIGRTPAGVRRWIDGYIAGRWPARCLAESLEPHFPRVLTPWHTAEEFEALPLTQPQQRFLLWAFRTGWRRPWPLGFTPDRALLGVVGAWANRVPFVLTVQQNATETLWQLREAEVEAIAPGQHGPV